MRFVMIHNNTLLKHLILQNNELGLLIILQSGHKFITPIIDLKHRTLLGVLTETFNRVLFLPTWRMHSLGVRVTISSKTALRIVFLIRTRWRPSNTLASQQLPKIQPFHIVESSKYTIPTTAPWWSVPFFWRFHIDTLLFFDQFTICNRAFRNVPKTQILKSENGSSFVTQATHIQNRFPRFGLSRELIRAFHSLLIYIFIFRWFYYIGTPSFTSISLEVSLDFVRNIRLTSTLNHIQIELSGPLPTPHQILILDLLQFLLIEQIVASEFFIGVYFHLIFLLFLLQIIVEFITRFIAIFFEVLLPLSFFLFL